MEKRGQAAMEFLMTYGWAILAAVIAIAVLAYFGVFSPSRLVPETCSLSAPLGCNNDKSIVSASDTSVHLFVVNGGDRDYNITDITVTGCTGTFTGDAVIAVGTEEEYIIAGCASATSGQQFRGTITVTYITTADSRDMTSTGSIVRKVIATP